MSLSGLSELKETGTKTQCGLSDSQKVYVGANESRTFTTPSFQKGMGDFFGQSPFVSISDDRTDIHNHNIIITNALLFLSRSSAFMPNQWHLFCTNDAQVGLMQPRHSD